MCILYNSFQSRRGRDHLVVGFIITYAIIVSQLTLLVRIPLRGGMFDTTLCDKVCQWLAADRWLSPGTPVSSTNPIYRHDTAELVLKVALNTTTLTHYN